MHLTLNVWLIYGAQPQNDQMMHYEVQIPNEHFPVLRQSQSLVSMDFLVSNVMGLLAEGLPALTALIRLFTCVYSQMQGQG